MALEVHDGALLRVPLRLLDLGLGGGALLALSSDAVPCC